ncbi:MAG: glycine cleavage system aminomethyltransferase GcvT, partial [Caenispirillum sp.]|nr:glycine cleavage system aminomethyltransferase GcvT [Caenispirillum sp.]
REGTVLTDAAGRPVGTITSGGFGASAGGPVAMGYVEAGLAAPDTALNALVREVPRPCRVAALPFVPHRYHRG